MRNLNTTLCLAVLAMLVCCTASRALAEKEWTFLVYCAADNDLAPFGLIDVNEMETVGSTDQVDIVVQFDGSEEYSPDAKGSCRYHIQKDDDFEHVTSPVVQDLGEVDMGSRKTLTDFLEWGVKNYPAKKYMVVLWNHGTGWYESVDAMTLDFTAPKDVQDLIEAVEQIQGGGGKADLDKYVASKRVQHLLKRRVSLRPFKPSKKTSVTGAVSKAICIDESTGTATALSTTDIGKALQTVREKHLGGGRLEVVGFDACLMGMIEVMHELRNDARWGVGSAKTEPGDGWPYDKVLARLVANPSMNGKELGTIVADEYTAHYDRTNQMAVNPFHKANTTQAVVDMDAVDALAKALGDLGTALSKPELREMCWLTVINTQHCGEIARTEPTVLLQLTAHRDIVHFATVLKAAVAQTEAAQTEAAQADAAQLNALADAVIAAHKGAVVHFKRLEGTPLLSVKNTNGLSVMIPFLKIDADYPKVEFGKGPWLSFMKFFKATPQEAQALIAMMTGQGAEGAEGEARKTDQRKRFGRLFHE